MSQSLPSRPAAPRPSAGLRRAGAALLASTLVAGGLATALPGGVAAADTASETAQALPYDAAPTATLRSSPRRVFAHYLPSLTVSLDDQDPARDYYARNYLTPTGEGGKHAAYGGFLRDRPLGRTPLGGSWRLRDMQGEVQQAISAGLDGFSLDVLQVQDGSVPQLWANENLLLQAAASVDPGFSVMIMPDMAASLGTKDVATLARGVAGLAQWSSAYRLADGRLVVAPFKAEAHSAAWWKSFMDTMRSSYGIEVALLPVFVGSEQTYAPSFAPISYGMSNWGSRNPAWNDPTTTSPGSPRGRAAAVKAMGKAWMQPVSVQDSRPNQGVFDEAQNTTNLRDTWAIARASGADLVQIPSWNDYTEGTAIAPSAKHGFAYLDLMAYYSAWYKTGAPPAVRRDTVYVSHRSQPYAARTRFPQTMYMHLRGGSPARDTVEALAFLTAPGTVTVRVGAQTTTCAAPAGVSACTVPLGGGTVGASTSRGGVVTATVTSGRPVTTTPYVQDLEYTAASSGRPTLPSSLPTYNTFGEGVGWLSRGNGLAAGQQLVSGSGTDRLVMQGDGNLVVYDLAGRALWNSRTFVPGSHFYMQADGNAVVYSPSMQPLWNAGTWGNADAQIVMQGDGNLVVYRTDGAPLWNSRDAR